ncbi:DUF1294 domain-containing protein [Bacillus sp. 2205SS5-2]|uniref:DUF1294 domain-containing protein n=1 Tax=Bacillus sp. 2205SS5-2 TaxID=3109031 RepID=UPI003007918B
MVQLLLGYLLMVNLVSFFVMRMDKQKAKKNTYRISEKTLWKLSWIGGAIGSFLGMKTFRHKTKHRVFAWGLPILAIIQVILISWMIIALS